MLDGSLHVGSLKVQTSRPMEVHWPLSFGRAVTGLKFTHHFTKNCALENAKLLHTVMNGRFRTPRGEDVAPLFPQLLSEVFAALQGGKINE